MHIPDGYLGPQTCAATAVAMLPCWSVASSRMKRSLRLREVPLLALSAAFCFVIMMFNVPIPGGTTGHAVGAVLVAVLFGPWAAVIVVSLALVVQALLFADGGIVAVGANCLTMAVVMPFVGWGVYHTVGSDRAGGRRRWLAAAAGGWAGLCAAAVVAGFLLGLQPLVAHDAAGVPLYCPFGLRIAVSTMALEHLLAFGLVEALVTGLVVAWLQRTAPELLERRTDGAESVHRVVPRLAAGLGVMVLLSPLGLFLPAWLHAGPAWGEWSAAEVQEKLDHAAPAGMVSAEQHAWHAPLPDYGLPRRSGAPLWRQSLLYLLCAGTGGALLAAVVLLSRKLLASVGSATADASAAGTAQPRRQERTLRGEDE
ncbi:MAG: cobalt transporter CbiM [Armatimonadetes bacterium]|nr:cobalt transporter CbiM [Armatimonadota bacterium]